MSDVDVVREVLHHLRDANGWRPFEKRKGIGDDVARVIASWWCPGDNTDTVAFVSTGAVPHDSSPLWFTLVPNFDVLDPDDQLAAEYLGTYLVCHAGRGPVPGWADLWVRPAAPEHRP